MPINIIIKSYLPSGQFIISNLSHKWSIVMMLYQLMIVTVCNLGSVWFCATVPQEWLLQYLPYPLLKIGVKHGTYSNGTHSFRCNFQLVVGIKRHCCFLLDVSYPNSYNLVVNHRILSKYNSFQLHNVHSPKRTSWNTIHCS